jgi:regulator of protease activity HflC (stomatin/prohibitin superfamily)
MWWNIAIPIASALMGANAANRRADQQANANKAAAEANRYSPWTNKSYGYNNNYAPSALEGGFSGAVQGGAIAQGLDGWLNSKAVDPTANLNAEQADNYRKLQASQEVPAADQFGAGNMWSENFSAKPNLYNTQPRRSPWMS